MKIRTERIECYFAKGFGRSRNYMFFVDFPREATKEEEGVRKAFGKFIKGKEQVEGRGYHWRVPVQVLREAIDFLPDPKAIKAEMERFDREGVKPSEHPYHVDALRIWNTELPTMISLTFEVIPEQFRRACDYWASTHHLKRDERNGLNLFGGRSMTIVADMLLAFESWLEFERPWKELYNEAFAARKQQEKEYKKQQWELDAEFREQYSDWEAWPEYVKNEIRWNARRAEREAEYERIREQFQQNYSRFYSFPFISTSKIDEAFKLLELPISATLDDLKRQYRKLAKKYHPDTGESEDQFKKLNNANELLIKHIEQKSKSYV